MNLGDHHSFLSYVVITPIQHRTANFTFWRLAMYLRLSVLFLAILIIPTMAFGQVNIVNFDFGAVAYLLWQRLRLPGRRLSCPYGYNTQDFDQSPGFGWILGQVAARQLAPTSLEGGSGLTGPNTIFYPAVFQRIAFQPGRFPAGPRRVCLANSQLCAGSYTLSFYWIAM